jgi:hypothetical protein
MSIENNQNIIKPDLARQLAGLFREIDSLVVQISPGYVDRNGTCLSHYEVEPIDLEEVIKSVEVRDGKEMSW